MTKNIVWEFMLLYLLIITLNMNKIKADIKLKHSNKCLKTAKELIQDNIETIPSSKKQEFINIYDSLTSENAEKHLATIEKVLYEIAAQHSKKLDEVRSQERKESGLYFMYISMIPGCITLILFLSYLFCGKVDYCRINYFFDPSIPLFGGGLLTLLFGFVGLSIYLDMDF